MNQSAHIMNHTIYNMPLSTQNMPQTQMIQTLRRLATSQSERRNKEDIKLLDRNFMLCYGWIVCHNEATTRLR